MERNSDSFLVLRAQSGDLAAYDALLRGIEAGLFRYLLSILHDRASAEDVLQDAFVIVYRKLGWLKDPALFKAWTYRIATREAFRRHKRLSRTEELPIDESIIDPGTTTAWTPEPQVLAKLPDLIGELSSGGRAVIVLHYAEGMTLDEIAEVLDVPIGTVKSRLNYALVNLRENLNLDKKKELS